MPASFIFFTPFPFTFGFGSLLEITTSFGFNLINSLTHGGVFP